MEKLRFRHLHLDFHTSEKITPIGQDFDKIQFQDMLKTGHINSANVFAKCHHGWVYYDSETSERHPGLDFDLFGQMVSAAHEIGVLAAAYISAGLDEKTTREHPEWLMRNKDETMSWTADFMTPGYHQFCFNSPYLDYLLSQVQEIITKYDVDGLWLDIVGVRECYCQNCVNAVIKENKDPLDDASYKPIWENTYANYTSKIKELVDRIKPGITIFHNGGHSRRGRRDLAFMNTHLELESLPTSWWGYDHFPLSVRYAQNLGMEYLGMTGKFHTSWGEFGGYKHPNALLYETAQHLMNGAKCSIGDQLHPCGLMDKTTYELIGHAYKEVEKKEEWCTDVTYIADVGVLSQESMNMPCSDGSYDADTGTVRILLEGKILFDMIDIDEDFGKYKVIILPDTIRITDELKNKLDSYKGKIFATGESGLNSDKNEFAVDFGIEWVQKNEYKPDYFKPCFDLKSLNRASFIMYSQGQKIKLNGGKELGVRENPYFNRSVFAFCSHLHTPSSGEYGGPGMVENENGIYFAWNTFYEYATHGSITTKESILHALDRLISDKTIKTDLPSQGCVSVMEQKYNNRFVVHLTYVSTVKRGKNIEIIEDIVPVYDINVSLNLDKKIKRAYLAPQKTDIDFAINDGRVDFKLQKLECHQMVVLEY